MSSKNYEATGRIHRIGETHQISEKFCKRSLILELEADTKYPQFVEVEFTGDRGEQLDEVSVGQDATVEYSLKGRVWVNPEGVEKFFTSLMGWRVNASGASAAAPASDEGAWG